ncbi:hypothetical protein CYY_005343 [Polysphondylium violaceum]|uniref:Uncharacterized protein n=1 Tax=Polysphondylium violaceum TaxID=133409 RepID=A0A8J4V4A4_9MYCE|nr:hypothetical protein CYY_005343 [Polysphondylium violaceum]
MPKLDSSNQDANTIIQYLLKYPLEGVFNVLKPIFPFKVVISNKTVKFKDASTFQSIGHYTVIYLKNNYSPVKSIQCLESKLKKYVGEIKQLAPQIFELDGSNTIVGMVDKLSQQRLASYHLQYYGQLDWVFLWEEHALPNHFRIGYKEILFSPTQEIPTDLAILDKNSLIGSNPIFETISSDPFSYYDHEYIIFDCLNYGIKENNKELLDLLAGSLDLDNLLFELRDPVLVITQSRAHNRPDRKSL